jgi:hypothetical protein
MVQGIVHGLSEYVRIVEEIHLTHIRRRMLRIKPSIGNGNDNDNEEPILLVICSYELYSPCRRPSCSSPR